VFAIRPECFWHQIGTLFAITGIVFGIKPEQCSGSSGFPRSVESLTREIDLDVGIVPVDDVLSPKGQARFLVLQRLVMSTWTLVALKHQVNTICRQLEEQGVNVTEIYAQIESLSAKPETVASQRSPKTRARKTQVR